MGKSTHPVAPVQTGTHPVTRMIDSSRAGERGSVQAAPQPVPAPQKQPGAVDYAQRVDVGAVARSGSKDLPVPDGNAASLQKPSDVKVETEH